MTGRPDITVARLYDAPPGDGRARLLIDGLWPRGKSKAALSLDGWLRDLAPSPELRHWFNHDPARWPEFRARYRAELDARPEAVARALDWCRRGPVTLLYAAHDTVHNNALVLRDYLAEAAGRDLPSSGSAQGPADG